MRFPKLLAALMLAVVSAVEGADTAWFDDARLGMFIHWGIYAVPARGEWVMNKESIAPADYEKFAKDFRQPASFSPEQWVLLAKRMGAKYVVLTTRHHDGFALWDTKTSDFNAMKVCGRDYVREFADACRKHGLRVGLYYSIIDWRYRCRPDGSWDAAVWNAYLRSLHGGLEEILSNYGKIDILWYDGCSSPKGSDPDTIDAELGIRRLNATARRLQPGILLNDRSLIDGDFKTPEQSLAAAPRGTRWESCMTLNRNWGFTADDADWKTPETVIRALLHCTRFGGNLLLNIGPRADGSVPEESVRRLEALGDYIARCPEAIYNARRDEWTEAVHEAGPVTFANGRHWLHTFGGESRLDGVAKIEPAAKDIWRVDFRKDAKPADWLGGRHDRDVKAGPAPVLGADMSGSHEPDPGPLVASSDPMVSVPSRGRWRAEIGYVNAEGFKDTARFAFETKDAETRAFPVPGAKGYYAKRVSADWKPTDPKRWSLAGVFPGNFVGTKKYSSIVEANDRDMLALAKTAEFKPVGAENDRAERSYERVSASWSAPKKGFGFVLGRTTLAVREAGVYSLAVAFEYWGDVYVNGKRIVRNPQQDPREPQFKHFKPIPFLAELKAGANEILVVNHGGSGAHYFVLDKNFDEAN